MSSLERLQRHVVFFITGFKCACVLRGVGGKICLRFHKTMIWNSEPRVARTGYWTAEAKGASSFFGEE